MTEYYFDIETTGLDPRSDELLALAYQKIQWKSPSGNLQILARWNTKSETELLNNIISLGVFDSENPFQFIPVGTNLRFDLSFILGRCFAKRLLEWDQQRLTEFYVQKPMKDIAYSLVLMNNGRFSGSGLDTFTSLKPSDGSVVPKLWSERNYRGIEDYIRADAAGFFQVYQAITADLEQLGARLRSETEHGGSSSNR